MKNGFDSLSLYRKLSEPVTKEVANERLHGFAEEFDKLREKYSIPSAIAVLTVHTINDDPNGDGESRGTVRLARGDVMSNMNALGLVFGQMQEELRQQFSDSASRGRKMAGKG